MYKVAQKSVADFGHWKLNNKEKETQRTEKLYVWEISNNSLEKPSKENLCEKQAIAWANESNDSE